MNKITYISYKIQSNLDHYLLLSSMHSNSTSTHFPYFKGLPNGSQQEKICLQCRRHRRCSFDPWVGKIPWRRKCNPLQYCCLKNHMNRGA